jgi:hypothetical protein
MGSSYGADQGNNISNNGWLHSGECGNKCNMQDMVAHLEKVRKEAAECEAIRDAAV